MFCIRKNCVLKEVEEEAGLTDSAVRSRSREDFEPLCGHDERVKRYLRGAFWGSLECLTGVSIKVCHVVLDATLSCTAP